MKKSRIAGLLLFVPLALLSACGGAIPLSFEANWYRDTTVSGVENTYEQLEYAVSFTQPESPAGPLTADYNGTFVTTLRQETITLGVGQQGGYVFETELNVEAEFKLGDKSSGVLTDYAKTHVEFLSVRDRLRPVKSHTEVKCNAPLANPSSIEDAYYEYDYSYDIQYDDGLTVAKVTYTDKKNAENSSEKEYELPDSGTYLDNEELLIALRGLTPSVNLSFSTLNTVMGSVQSVALRDVTETQVPVDFTAGDTQVKSDSFDAYSFSIGFSSSNAAIGQSKTVVVAKKTENASANLYHNVIVSMSVPVLQSLGTMEYTLKKATFTAK